MLDRETLKELSKKLKIDLFTIYREYLQFLFLKYFYEKKGTEKVYFKGWTSLHFLFGYFRFFEDLDFTSLLAKRKIQILIDEKILQDLTKETDKISFKKEKSIANSFSGRIFQEIPEFKFPLTVRIDFSFREKLFLTTSSFIEIVFPIKRRQLRFDEK